MAEQAEKVTAQTGAAAGLKLKTTVFLYLFTVFLIVGLLVIALLKFYAFKTLSKTERLTLHEKNIQIIRSIQNELDQLRAFAADWGEWSDSYQFLKDKNADYIASNMGEGSLENLATLGILYLDLDFREFYSYTTDDRRRRYDQVIAQIEEKKELFLAALHNGSDRVLLYHPGLKTHFWSVIQPIIPGDGTTVPDGYLVLTKEINDRFYEKISRLFGTRIIPFENGRRDTYECLDGESENQFCQRVFLVDDAKAVLEVAIEDAEQQKSIYLQSEASRDLNQQIKVVFNNTLWVLLASGLLIILLNLIVINRLIVRPATYLSHKFSAFARKRTLHRRLREFGPQELRTLTRSANLMLEELEGLHTQLESLSRTDELTGVYNRRYFHEMFTRDKAHAIRAGEYLALLLLDIDFFKQYNDMYGHVAGDQCLKSIADILRSNVKRNNDVIARYGGEEFIILLSDTPLPCVQSICKRISRSLAEAAIPHAGSTIASHVTCSIGGIAVIPTLETTEENLILRADQLLYRAKAEGRNRAILSDRL